MSMQNEFFVTTYTTAGKYNTMKKTNYKAEAEKTAKKHQQIQTRYRERIKSTRRRSLRRPCRQVRVRTLNHRSQSST